RLCLIVLVATWLALQTGCIHLGAKMNIDIYNSSEGNIHIWEGKGTTNNKNRLEPGEWGTVKVHKNAGDVLYHIYTFSAGRDGTVLDDVECSTEYFEPGEDREVHWVQDDGDCWAGCLICWEGWDEFYSD
ncbi:MAG: hypothetical protein HN348_01560, partial [Proteobacteria bacterium]|nr:hypothetical protein [Pseudomonadota bacterium]